MTIHALCASEAAAVEIPRTARPVREAPVGEMLIDALAPREGIEHAGMAKAAAHHAIRATHQAQGLPPRVSRLEILDHDQEDDLQRNQVERLFHNLQQFGRVATRYEKLTAHFRAFVLLALIVIMLR